MNRSSGFFSFMRSSVTVVMIGMGLWACDRQEASSSREQNPVAAQPSAAEAPTWPAQAQPQFQAKVVDAHRTRDVVDWTGYYKGMVPCGSCPGIDTWLVLDEVDGKISYQLIETYLSERQGTFRSSGLARWRKDASVLELRGKDESRVLLVGEGYVEFLGEGRHRGEGRSAYALRKLDAYAGGREQLLVDPARVTTGKRKGRAIVRFAGLINFEHETEAGHRSLWADFVIDCAGRRYEMPSVRYYAKDFGTGRLLNRAARNTTHALPFVDNDDVLAQVAAQYCPQDRHESAPPTAR